MQITTRFRPRTGGWIGTGIVLLLPPAIGAAYVGALNATSFDDRGVLWQVTIALSLAHRERSPEVGAQLDRRS